MRTQFHCSNTSNLCDRCGKALSLHSVGDYYCPLPQGSPSKGPLYGSPHLRKGFRKVSRSCRKHQGRVSPKKATHSGMVFSTTAT